MVVGDSPPIQDGEAATEEPMAISYLEELISKEEIEEHRDIDADGHTTGSSLIDEGKKSDEDETSSEDIQAIREDERISEEEVTSVDVPPMTETTSIILELVNDHPTRQESKEQEGWSDEVSVLYFSYVIGNC